MSSRDGRFLSGIDEILAPAHTVLVIVDAQNDFVHSDGFLAKFGIDMTHIQAAVPRINDFVVTCRLAGVTVIFIREIVSPATVLPNFLSHYRGFDKVGVQEGTWGAQFYDGLIKPESGERIIIKPSYDGFEDTNLDVTLRSLGLKTCLYAGFASNVCVESTARHGFVKGYYSVLLTDASAAGSIGEHDAFKNVFKTFYGPTLRTDEVAAVWAASVPPRGPASKLSSLGEIPERV